jgi:hypothetical protein
MSEIRTDHSRTYFVRASVAVFLAVSFGSVLTVADVSSLAYRPVDELTTMGLYWGYVLLPAVLLLAAHSAGMLGKSCFAFSLLALCLLCACLVWRAAVGHDGWVWVEYWPACVTFMLVAVLVHLARRRFGMRR